MSMTDFADITAYYDASRIHSEHVHAVSLAEIFDRVEEPFVRWPVRNREPRTPIESQKRAIIHERDGGICRLCGTGGHLLTVDHIIPRSIGDVNHTQHFPFGVTGLEDWPLWFGPGELVLAEAPVAPPAPQERSQTASNHF